MAEYYSYVTVDNDRWDKISNKFYKTPNLYEKIIQANPNIPRTPLLSAGIKLNIPILEESQTIKFELPPWKK